MRIALELARTNPIYQDLASKFFEHFLYLSILRCLQTPGNGRQLLTWSA